MFLLSITGYLGPYLYFSGSHVSRLLERCGWTTETYAPSPFIFNGFGHTQRTIQASLSSHTEYFEREILTAPNGSTLGIDWYDHPEDMAKKYHGIIVILNHGCTQRLSKSIIRHIIRGSQKEGVGCCVINMQGVNDVPSTTTSIGTSLSLIVELKAITERLNQHLGSHFPKSIVAFSIAGIPLIDYLSQDKGNYTSTSLVSTPLALKNFCMGDNVSSDACVADVHDLIKANSDILTSWNLDVTSKVAKATTLAEFYDGIGSVSGSTAASFFHSLEPYSRISQIAKPIILFYALDDESIQFTRDVDLIRLCKNPNVAVCVTEHGGHCGFHTLSEPNWIGSAVLEYLSASMRPEF